MTAPRLRAVALTLGLGLLVAPALSGCIPSVDDLVGGLVQQGIEAGLEQATGLDYSSGTLPADFPSDVPLIEGELVGGVGVNNDDGTKGWAVVIETDRTVDDVKALLESAGFAEITGLADSGMSFDGFIAFENDRYTVTAIFAPGDGDKNNINYVVAPK